MTLSITTFSITTLIITTFRKRTISIRGLFATLSVTTLCHYAEYRVYFIVMLNVIMLNVIMLNVIMLVANAKFSLLKLLIYEPYYLCLSRLECQA